MHPDGSGEQGSLTLLWSRGEDDIMLSIRQAGGTEETADVKKPDHTGVHYFKTEISFCKHRMGKGLPIFLRNRTPKGNLIQPLIVGLRDSVIVGKILGEEALAAVGTSTPIMNIAILLISGMCMGASVLMSSQYGAEDYIFRTELTTRK